MRKTWTFSSFLALLALCFLLLFPTFAHAKDRLYHALAMHGLPSLKEGFGHYPYANPDAPKGGTIHQGVTGTFDTLNPFTLKGKPAYGPALSLLYDRLMDRSWDEPFTLYPLIARAVTMPDDRSGITFFLDPRARFLDGTPITAQDVLFSFETFKGKGRPNMRRVYKLVSTVTIIDKQTIHFTFGPGYDRETCMILAMMPVLSKSYWEKRDFNTAALDPHMNTSGPYRIETIDIGRRLVLRRSPIYWAATLPVRKGLNNVDILTYDYFRDDMVAFESFKTGELDFRRETNIARWSVGYDFNALSSGAIHRITRDHHRAEDIRGFILNTRRPPFDDPRVRQALSIVFDFDWANKNLYGGLLSRTNSFFPNTDLADQGTAPPQLPLRDALKKAATLLEQAGYAVESGQRIHEKTGNPLAIDLILSAPEEEKIALSYASTLKKLGISLKVRTLDAASFRNRMNEFDYDMVSYAWLASLSPGGEQQNNWTCAAKDQKGGFNYAGICDPVIDRLTKAISHAQTRSELRTATQALDRALLNGYYVIFWGHNPRDLIAAKNWISWPDRVALWGFIPETMWVNSP